MMNKKECGKEHPWPTQSTLPKFSTRYQGKLHSQCCQSPRQDFNLGPE